MSSHTDNTSGVPDPENKPRRRDDELWKGILEDVFSDFLRFFFPNAEQLFDMKRKFVFLDKEFSRLFPPEANTAGVRFVDKLVKVHLKEGGTRFILVHVEVQGQKGNEDLSERMYRYFYRAKDKHNASITAFAILIDEVKSYRPGPHIEEYLGTKITYEFNTYKLLDQDEAKLRANPNPFAVVALVVLLALKNKKASDVDLKMIKLDLTKELIKRKVGKAKYEKIMDFLTYYVNFENKEMMINFEKEVQQLTGRTTTMGVREILLERREKQGLEKGLEEGVKKGIQLERTKAEIEKQQERREIARSFKNIGVAIEDIAKATGLSIKEVEEII